MSLLSEHESWLSFNPFKRQSKQNIRAILVPHAGIEQSKEVATRVFSLIPKEYTHAIVLSTNHFTSDNHILESNTLDEFGHSFQIDNLGLNSILDANDDVFRQEHSWKVQIPFLTHLGFKIITPILIGNHSISLVDELHKRLTSKHFIIVNTDLLHCGTNYGNMCPSDIEAFNQKTLQNMIDYHNGTVELQHKRDGYTTMCGHSVMKTFLDLSKKLNLKLEQSDHISHKWDNGKHSVGYPNMHFTSDVIKLLQVPRLTLDYVFNNAKSYNDKKKILDEMDKKFNYETKTDAYGIFVTIEKNGKLRGCIGSFDIRTDLGRFIAEKTLDSAFNDSRFPKVTADELSELTFKVNFLSKPEVIYSGKDKLEKEIYEKIKNDIIINIHGITITFESGRATYLASVLPEHFNIKEFTLGAWLRVASSLRQKTMGSGKIVKVERYKCQEFSEDKELVLEGGEYFNYQLPLFLLGLAWLSLF